MQRRHFLASTAAAALAPAAGRQPNLLFIIADQFRFDALGCAGNKVVQTPNLDRLAREGVCLENAMSACPVCVPSRTSMLTGKSMANTNVHNNEAAKDTGSDIGPSFDNILHDRGYRSQYYGKYHAPYRMALTYDNKVAAVNVPGLPNEHKEFLAWLDKHSPAREPRRGELLNNDYQRPYKPYPVDPQYADAQAGVDLSKNKHASQQEVFGVVQVPREFSLAAYPTDRALRAIEDMKNSPFSLTCSIGPPHPPFLAVEPFAAMYPAPEMPLPHNHKDDMQWSPYRQRAEAMSRYRNPDYARQFKSAYYAMVQHVDDQIGHLLKRLDELKLADHTLVVFTADHGEMLCSHGLVSKMTFYEEAVHVPLLMRMPGAMQAGTVVRHPVSGMDLFATVLDYLGVPAPPRDGDSLRPLIAGGRPGGPDFRVSEWAVRNVPNYMVRTLDWKLMIADSPESKGVDALYDLKNDPYEMRNLLGAAEDRAKYAPRAREMKDRLISWLERVHSPALGNVKERQLA